MKYWSRSGLSNPNWRRRLSMYAGLAAGPARAIAGSPGTRWMMKKLIVTMENSTGITCKSRTTIYVRSMTAAPRHGCAPATSARPLRPRRPVRGLGIRFELLLLPRHFRLPSRTNAPYDDGGNHNRYD